MTFDGLTLPVTLELCPKSKALLAFLQRLAADGAPMTVAEPAPAATLTPPAMGEYWQGQGGHYICTLPALLDMPARHLIASAGQAEDLTFGSTEEISGADCHINGDANTVALRSSGKKHPAADWARAYTADGHTDFFLPARLDMVMAHICAKQLFKTSGYYWTSTQGSRTFAFVQDFENGNSFWSYKGLERRVRAFRVIPLQPSSPSPL